MSNDKKTARDAIEDVIADSPNWQGDDWALDFLDALGIPADAALEDVKAGMARMRHLHAGLTRRVDGKWEAWSPTFDGYGHGYSPSEAILALSAKIEAQS